MFEKSKKHATKDLFGKTNRIVEGTFIHGDIKSVADFRLDGELIGDFFCEGKIVIGPTGKVIGNIICKNADIEGLYEGKIQVAEMLTVKSKASIRGEVVVGRLSVEPGAEFSATCQMRSNLKKVDNVKNEQYAKAE